MGDAPLPMAVSAGLASAKTADLTFFTTEEAAEFLRVSPRTLERWRLDGTGPRFRCHGKSRLYAIADLMAWSDDHIRQSTSEAA